jgi:hypothetical protein
MQNGITFFLAGYMLLKISVNYFLLMLVCDIYKIDLNVVIEENEKQTGI